MIRLSPLMVGLLLLTMSAWAKKPAPPLNKGHEKMLASLLRRCEDGVASACHNYGKALLAHRSHADQKKGGAYIRRACTLAYAPACSSHPVTEEKKVKESPSRVDSKGKPCTKEQLTLTAKFSEDQRVFSEVGKDSLWAQAGAQAGDEIISVNGEAYSGPQQIGNAFEHGGAVLNVKRNGRETSFMLRCP